MRISLLTPLPVLLCQTAKSRSQARRLKVGRLEPGDLWGMQHMHNGTDAEFEVVAVEGCEVSKRASERASERFDVGAIFVLVSPRMQ